MQISSLPNSLEAFELHSSRHSQTRRGFASEGKELGPQRLMKVPFFPEKDDLNSEARRMFMNALLTAISQVLPLSAWKFVCV